MLLLTLFIAFAADSQVGGRTSPDGSEHIQIDLPGTQQLKNIGGRDGAGLCVFTSVEHAGRWQNVPRLEGFQSRMKQELGGGWPEKLDKMIGKHAPGIAYLQYSGDDPGLLRLALKTGRMPAVTYGYSPRYGGSGRIAHMVNLVHLSEKWAAVLDNNFVGENNYEWMAPGEFIRRWKLGGGGWAVFLLAPPPPPPPAGNPLVEARPPRRGNCWVAGPAPAVAGDDAEPDEEAKPAPYLFGVDLSQATQARGCWHNGRRITALEAERILEGGELSDDTHKLRVTIIGDPASTRRVQNDIEASAWGPVCLVQAYLPGHWAVSQIGLPTDGDPRILIQAPPGADGSARVLHSQGDYQDGLDGLISALRRKAPNYDPQRDKDGRKGVPDGLPLGGLVMARVVAVTALVSFVLGWMACRFLPGLVAMAGAARSRVFPPKPSMEEMILAAMERMEKIKNDKKEKEASNG